MDKFFKTPFFYCLGITPVIFLGLIWLFSGFGAGSFPESQLTENKISCLESARTFITPKELAKETPDLSIIEKNSLAAASPPIVVTPQVLGALIGGYGFGEERRTEIVEYIVEPGDNLWSIAAEFNISLNTILWANDLNQNSILRLGKKLIILPVSGIVHYVEKGETLSEIAETYKGETKEILVFNGIEDDNIFVGDILIIPDGKMPARITYAPVYAPLASSYFICPIAPPCRITQGLHWYNAIDFSHAGISCGEPVFAAAQGAVQKTGYTSRWGKFVRILHPNGVVTYYGHLQDILVKPGEKVSQGTIIGHIGYTGYTIPAGPAGCHVHFDVRGARNPFAQ